MASLTKIETALSFNPLNPIGSILDSAMNDVEKTLNNAVNKAHDAANDILMKAGEQAMSVISSLKGAYIDSLEVTYDKADQLLRENIDRVTDLVNTLITGEQSALLKVADKVQDIIKLSPLSNWWLPLLSDTSPEFFAVDVDPMDPTKSWITKVMVTFTGNFAYADRAGCTPSFVLNDKEFAPVSNNSKELKFLVTVSSNDPKLDMHKYSYLSGTLKVMWNNGYVAWPWAWKTSTYRTLLGVLPTTPGSIKVLYTTPASSIRKTVTLPDVQITRDKKHWNTRTCQTQADPGWHVVPGSASMRWIEGPFSQCNGGITSVDHDVICYKWNFKNGSGKFTIVFDEEQPVAAKLRTQTVDTLKWGNSFIAAPNDGEKITEIDFDAFNGNHTAFQPRTDATNPFIELREFQGAIQVKAKSASDLNDHSVHLAQLFGKNAAKSEDFELKSND